MSKLLDSINTPNDLKKIAAENLPTLASELRDEIINTISGIGGHLSSSLGAVDIAVAVHYVFDTPRDKIIWDVGHQAYAHKILTGRREAFKTIRQFGGISGFPVPSESPYEAFGVRHSSTSISAAMGMAVARDLNHENYRVIAIIGDGSLSSGIAFEGLNQAGHLKKDMIVILNDNEMSISQNVGALSSFLSRKITGRLATRLKKETKSFLEGIPKVGSHVSKIAQKAEEMLKGLFLPGIIFEELGFNYVGPIDGHNIELLIETLKRIKTASTPTLVHVVTKKGKGYKFSEKSPSLFHGIGPFKVETGSLITGDEPTYSDAFGNILTDLAAIDKKIVAISAAMKEGTG